MRKFLFALVLLVAAVGISRAGDIENALWSETGSANTAALPNGFPANSPPSAVYTIVREVMGAIKRAWNREGPTITSVGTNTIALTYTTAPASYIQGQKYSFIAGGNNSGATTLNVNGLGAKAVTKNGTTALAGGEILTGAVVTVMYDGTQFQLTDGVLSTAFTGGTLSTTTSMSSVAFNEADAGSLASASTTNIGAAAGNSINITGTTTITAFDTVQAGTIRFLRFAGALTLTHNASTLILPNNGSNITTAAGDVAVMESLGSGNWKCLTYQKANGQALQGSAVPPGTLLNVQTFTASGTYTRSANVTKATIECRGPGGVGGAGGSAAGAGSGGGQGGLARAFLKAVGSTETVTINSSTSTLGLGQLPALALTARDPPRRAAPAALAARQPRETSFSVGLPAPALCSARHPSAWAAAAAETAAGSAARPAAASVAPGEITGPAAAAALAPIPGAPVQPEFAPLLSTARA
jgi:hypothetical protein